MKTLETVLVLFFCFTHCYSQECPQPTVKKRTIIRSAESIDLGAKLLRKLTVSSARDCYKECCNTEVCNVAVMHYKQDYENGEEIMKKFCFLFDCGSPSVCTFDEHTRYAVIEIPKKKYVILPTISEITQKIKTTPEKEVKDKTTESPISHKIQHEKCPAGAPVAMCADNPCDKKVCASNKNAVCKPSFCGGCFAKFYDTNGIEVKCTGKTEHHNEEVLEVASTDYEEETVDELPGPAKKHPDPTGDPYFQSDRRKWVDGTETGHLTNATLPDENSHNAVPHGTEEKENRVIVVNTSFMSVPLMIALCICIVLILGLIYRFKCAPRGKPKKLPVDDGDYLINGMYL